MKEGSRGSNAARPPVRRRRASCIPEGCQKAAYSRRKCSWHPAHLIGGASQMRPARVPEKHKTRADGLPTRTGQAPGARSAPTRKKILLDTFSDLWWSRAITEQKSAAGRQCSLAFVTVFLGGPWVMNLAAADAGSALGEHEWTVHHSGFYTCAPHFGGLPNKFTGPFISPRAGWFPSQTRSNVNNARKETVQAKGLIHTSPGQRPGFRRGCVLAGQRPASPGASGHTHPDPHATSGPASIPRHNESRFQRSAWTLAVKPRALPWAGMNDAVGVPNRPPVPPEQLPRKTSPSTAYNTIKEPS